jgi:hypothetical protein
MLNHMLSHSTRYLSLTNPEQGSKTFLPRPNSLVVQAFLDPSKNLVITLAFPEESIAAL